MKQTAKATILVLFASLLSGCSSSETKACEAAEASRNSYTEKAAAMQSEADAIGRTSDIEVAFKKFKLEQDSKATYKLSLQVIVTYKECFTPEQVVEAQQYIDSNQ
jgi:uncharacterized lipoprotein